TLIRQLNQRRQPTKNIEVLPISFAPTESSLFTTPLLLSHHSYVSSQKNSVPILPLYTLCVGVVTRPLYA
ncbi:MAG: hypothetical protein ACI95X_002135, partial [Paraglaciecola sp.]